MNQAVLPITGYLDRFSHRPGETFSAFVSVRDGGRYRARLVRVLSGDANPDGPGVRFEDLAHRFDQSFDGRRQAIQLGSYGVVGAAPVRDVQAACTWTVVKGPHLRVCTIDYAMNNGLIATTGFINSPAPGAPVTLVVEGGTGAFKDVRGYGKLQPTPTGSGVTLFLTK